MESPLATPWWLPLDRRRYLLPGWLCGKNGGVCGWNETGRPSSGVTGVTVDSFCMIWVTSREEALWLQLLSTNIHNEGQGQ